MKKIIALLFLFCSPLLADDCTVSSALISIRPGAGWSMSNNDPSTLEWGSVQPKPTLLEIQNAIDACNLANTPVQQNLKARSDAINDLLTGTDDKDKLVRAILQVVQDETNRLRQRDTDRAAAVASAVASATSLADLKSRWSAIAIPNLDQTTVQQFVTAVQNKINSGASD